MTTHSLWYHDEACLSMGVSVEFFLLQQEMLSFRKGWKAVVVSWLNGLGRVSGIAFALAVSRGKSFERQSCRERLLADRQGNRQHAIAVGDVGARGIDRDWERQLAVIDPNAPFIQQEFLDLLEHAAQVPVENQATLSRDFDHNVLGFESSHRCRNHQALVRPVDLDWNVLLLQLLLHAFHLSCLAHRV